MIVKDEEELIQDAIYSVAWADEIILVDTGCTDKTIEIAQKAAVCPLTVYNYEWDDDFSAARNFAMSKATKHWIFTLDADERVLPKHGETIKKMMPDIKEDILAVTVANVFGKDQVAQGVFPHLRFFRRSSNPSYSGRVHNKPLVPAGSTINRIPFTMYHVGYDLPEEKMLEKHERRVRMCRRALEDDPDIEAHYNLVRALKVKVNGVPDVEAKDEMFDLVKKGLALNNGYDPNNIYVQFLSLAGWIYHAFEDHKEGIKYAKKALAYKPDYLDAILLLGMCYTYGVNANTGEQYLYRYLEEQRVYDFDDTHDHIAMEHANSRIQVHKALIDIEQLRNRKANAERMR
jgi:glycosyltransferase involved in cell wall biosynthesis